MYQIGYVPVQLPGSVDDADPRFLPDEFGTLADLVATATAAGFRPLAVSVASQAEWDDFESGYARGYETWLLAHPDHPGADEIRAKADGHRQGYLGGYREVLGFAYLSLVLP